MRLIDDGSGEVLVLKNKKGVLDFDSRIIAAGLGVMYNGGRRTIWPCHKGES